MKKQSHYTLAADAEEAQLARAVKGIVTRLFEDGEIEVEFDDSHLVREIETVRTEVRNVKGAGRTSAETAQLERRIADIERDVAQHSNATLDKLSKLNDQVRSQLISITTDLAKMVKDDLAKVDAALRPTIDAAIADRVSANLVYDEAKLRQIADSVFQNLFTVAAAKEVKNGEKVPLPPLLKVDPFFVENDQTRRIERSLKTRVHVMASGPSGSGKTYPIEQVLRKHGRRYVKVSVADGMTLSHFLSRTGVRATDKGTETFSTYGFLPFTMKNNIALILDEVDKCQPEILSVLNAALEYRSIYLPDTGETVTAGDEWQVFMTCNSLRDTTGLYQGFRLDAALLNRIGLFVKADYLAPSEECAILQRVGIAAKDAKVIVGLFNGLRKAYEAGKLTSAPSTRIAVRIVRAMLGQDDDGKKCAEPVKMIDAFAECFLDGLPDNEAKEAAAILQNGL